LLVLILCCTTLAKVQQFALKHLGGGGATRPLPTDGSVEDFLRDSTVGPYTSRFGTKVKKEKGGNERSNTKNAASERLRCGTIQKKVH